MTEYAAAWAGVVLGVAAVAVCVPLARRLRGWYGLRLGETWPILVGRLSGLRAVLVPGDLWERVAPLLPPAPERRRRYPGRLRVPDRTALVGVLYVLGPVSPGVMAPPRRWAAPG